LDQEWSLRKDCCITLDSALFAIEGKMKSFFFFFDRNTDTNDQNFKLRGLDAHFYHVWFEKRCCNLFFFVSIGLVVFFCLFFGFSFSWSCAYSLAGGVATLFVL
jgi:hypothetical protein